MNLHEADRVLRKMDGIWVLRTAHTNEDRNEWLDFLLGYDFDAMTAAVDALKEQLKWRPSMAELREAYRAETANREAALLELPGDVDPAAASLADRYGAEQRDWVYCWKCDMAISLKERAGAPVFTEGLGLSHHRCPKGGSSPLIPQYMRTDRDDYWAKHHVRKPDVRGRYRSQESAS